MHEAAAVDAADIIVTDSTILSDAVGLQSKTHVRDVGGVDVCMKLSGAVHEPVPKGLMASCCTAVPNL